MPGDEESELGFEALDALLDEALALEGAELDAFLGNLGNAQREALLKLLRRSRSDALRRIRAAAQTGLPAAGAGAADAAGNWRLIREIGSGGTGQVFYAERREPDGEKAKPAEKGFVQRAAVKILWSHRVSSQFRDRFLRERRILASISHPGLARFLDGGLLGDGRPWFAMEYVEGSDIVTYATSQTLERRIELFLAVADTIEYAHARLIVHRDIKPPNVLVDSLGQPRVLDFGIARVLGEVDNDELTRAQGTPVTLQYASPEQVTGGSIDVASDVYQLGLLLFEILTGRRPYGVDEASLQQAIDTITLETPPPPSAFDRTLDRDLDAIVGQALRKQPQRRYASAAAMADDLRRFLDGRPVTARPHSTWYVTTRFVRRHALPVAIAAASVIALSVATVFSVRMALQARADAERSRATQEILADVFEQADPFGEGGAEISLADALVRAKPSIDEKVAWDPRLAWEVNRTLAEIFSSLDLLDLEKGAYEDARAAALELGGDNEKELLYAIAGLGNILARTDPAEAVRYLEAHLPDEPSSESGAVDWLSAKYAEVSAWIRLHDDERVDEGAREMARVAEQFSVSAPRTLGRISQLLAGASRRAGDIDAADAHWERAVEYMRLAEQPAGHAVMLSNMALHYGVTGRFDESDAAFRRAIAVFREHAPEDPSHADVLRLYAGLQFRMRRPQQALATIRESISILDRDRQGYAYFVAQLNRAGFAFAAGAPTEAFDAIHQGLDVAFAAFGPDSDVTRRMYPVFARLLLFAGRDVDAARLVGVEDARWCGTDTVPYSAIDDALRILADAPSVEEARQAAWSEIHGAAERARVGTLDAVSYADIVAAHLESQNVFFDVLDRWRMLPALADAGVEAGLPIPADLAAEIERLESLHADAGRLLTASPGDAVSGLLAEARPAPYPNCQE